MLEAHYPIYEQQLGNGMRVLANPMPEAPGVAVNLWYRVGSADDPRGSSGFAHLFEHLMFAGSAQVANNEHLGLIEAVGGQANATTSFDRTNYFQTVPPHAAELALWLEADRMASLAVTQDNLDTQREVVKEEKRQRYDNQPYGDLLELILAVNFPEDHPYRTPTIGSMADLDAATLDQVRGFHDRWYAPDQASLVICGPLQPDQVFALAEKYFSEIPASGNPRPARTEPLPPHSGVPRTSVTRPVPTSTLHQCWRTAALGKPDELPISVALSVLGAGQSSRLQLRLVKELQAAEAVSANDFGLARGNSCAYIEAWPSRTSSLDQLEQIICEEIDRLAEQGPTAEELDRVMANSEREWFSELATADGRADSINEFAVLLDDPEQVNQRLAKMRAVTAEDVQQAAASWLNPNARAVLEYHSEETK